MHSALAPAAYALLNICSSTAIVFANKSVFSIFDFHFPYALTLLHTLLSLLGMHGFLQMNLFEEKDASVATMAPLAIAYVSYIVLGNLSLELNPVGFYQITKIAVAPMVLVIEYFFYDKQASRHVVASVLVVCAGVGVATVTDPQINSNLQGLFVGLASVGATALYQIWAGSMQKELKMGSMQLLHQYLPLAAAILAVLVPICEPVGWKHPVSGTLLGYPLTWASFGTIGVSSVLGLLVNLSTFLLIGATSSLTFNIVGHIKTVLILAGGVIFFGDSMAPQKLLGVAVALGGIGWYSHIKLDEARQAAVEKLITASAGAPSEADSQALLPLKRTDSHASTSGLKGGSNSV